MSTTDTYSDTDVRTAFSMVKGLKVNTGQMLLDKIGDMRRFFDLDEHELRRLTGLDDRIVSSSYRTGLLERGRKENEFADSKGIHRLFFADGDYPAMLRECEDGPAMLYKLGDADLDAMHPVAIVGTRKSTAYGNTFTARLVEELAKAVDGLLIVSGLAYGIDIAAHRAALKAGVPTVAVLAHPLNMVYPAEHRDAAAQIVHKGGALVTEYPTGSQIHRSTFLERNRIIAGLCKATIVVESDLKGGAMMTANMACAYNRDVFATPGRTTDRCSRGTNRLIYENKAALLSSAEDIIETLRWTKKAPEGTQHEFMLELTDMQRDVLRIIEEVPQCTANDIAMKLCLPYSQFSDTLFQLEMAQLITSVPGGRFQICAIT